MKFNRRRIIRTSLIVFGSFILLIACAMIYLTVNKDKIIAQVKLGIEKNLKGKLQTGKIELSFLRNFPYASVLIEDVVLTDSLYGQHGHVFFQAREVFASLSISGLIRKKSPMNGLRIDEGSIYIFTDSTGYSNKYLMEGNKDNIPSKEKDLQPFNLKRVETNKFHLTIDDRSRRKLHKLMLNHAKFKIKESGNILFVDAKLKAHVGQLAFKQRKGSYLAGQSLSSNFDFKVDRLKKEIRLDEFVMKISGQPFTISGFFALDPLVRQFELKIKSKGVKYEFVKNILTAKIARSLSIVQLDKPVDVYASIGGSLGGGDPLVTIRCDVDKTNLKTPFMDFEKATFTSYFTNEVQKGLPRLDPNSSIRLRDFKAEWKGLPVNSKSINIINLEVPELSCDLSSEIDLKDLNALLESESLDLLSGKAAVNLSYKGPIEKNEATNSFINGSVTFSNGTVKYVPRNVSMEKMSGTIAFKNSDVFIQNLRTTVFGQPFIMNGSAKKLLTLINVAPSTAIIEYDVFTPSLNLSDFTYLFKKRSTVARKKTKGSLQNVATKIDQLLEQGKIHLTVKASQLRYKNFDATNAKADITLLTDRYVINNVGMNHAGGTFGLNGELVNAGTTHNARLNVNMNNVNIKHVFRSFNNFGQDGITAESLEGQLTTKVNAALKFNEAGEVLPSTLEGKVDFSLKNGALINYEPVKKMQRFVFKNRDFDNIRFAELKNTLEIKNREITINKMEIQSTVLYFFVEGIYSQLGNTDMSVQIPLGNLKKRDADVKPENIGLAKKTGNSIYLRGRTGEDGNVKFKLDLFNRYDKKATKNR